MADEGAYVEVQVEEVGQVPPGEWVVQLVDSQGRKLQIRIGQCEAFAIGKRCIAGFEPQRPLTQDLALALWKRLGGEMVQLRIDDLFDGIYYSKLMINQDGEPVEIDCRPSDGLALALTAKVPIYIADSVMRRGRRDEPDENIDAMLQQLDEDEDEDEGDLELPDDDDEPDTP